MSTPVTAGSTASVTLTGTGEIFVEPASRGITTVTVVRSGALIANHQFQHSINIGPYLVNDVVKISATVGASAYTVNYSLVASTVPPAPATGTYFLKVVNGVYQWLVA